MVYEVSNDMIDKFIITSFYEKGYYFRCFLFITGLYTEENDFINYTLAIKVSVFVRYLNNYIKDHFFFIFKRIFLWHNGVKLLLKFQFLPYYLFYFIIYLFNGLIVFMENFFSYIESKKKTSIYLEQNIVSSNHSTKEHGSLNSEFKSLSTVQIPELISYAPSSQTNLASHNAETSSKAELLVPTPNNVMNVISPEIVMNAPTPEILNNVPSHEITLFNEAYNRNEDNSKFDSTDSMNASSASTQMATQRGRRRLINNK